VRVTGTSFADLQANIGALQRVVARDSWELALKRHPGSTQWERYRVKRSMPLKVPTDLKQRMHFEADLELNLSVISEPVIDVGEMLIDSRISPAGPTGPSWPAHWERSDNVFNPVRKGPNQWWFFFESGKSADQTVWYGRDGSTETGTPLEIIGGQDYKLSFQAIASNFSGEFTAWVWFYKSDWTTASTAHAVVYDRTTHWETDGKAVAVSGTFMTPQNAAYAKVKFNLHETSTTGAVKIRSVTLGVHF